MAERLGLTIAVREVSVRDAQEARRLRALGSPTVLVEGQDVDPAARGLRSYGMT